MKKYLFLIFAVTMLLFCSASHEAFSGKSPPGLSVNFNDDYNEISVPGFTTISSLENVDNNVVYNAAIAVEEANYSILFNSQKLYLNPESPVVAIYYNYSSTLLSNNPTNSYKYAAVTRKFVITNDSYFYNSTTAHNKPIISGMQFKSSLWN